MDSSKKLKNLGYCIPDSKISKMGLGSFFEHSKQQGINCIKVDLSKDLESQGPFDILINKVISDLVQENTSEKSHQRMVNLRTFLSKHSDIIVIDPIESQLSALDRDNMSILLSKVEKNLPKDMKVKNPLHRFYPKECTVYDTKDIQFPVVCKVNQAGGSSVAHKMGIVFNEKGLHDFKPPMIAQEFKNHNSTIFKIFVVGDYLNVVKRKSLPNMPNNLQETIFFDSQHPLDEQLEKVKPGITKIKEESIEMEYPPNQTLKSMSKEISQIFNMTLFGFDVITEASTGFHSIIDINYFPGYAGVENLDVILLKFLEETLQSRS